MEFFNDLYGATIVNFLNYNLGFFENTIGDFSRNPSAAIIVIFSLGLMRLLLWIVLKVLKCYNHVVFKAIILEIIIANFSKGFKRL